MNQQKLQSESSQKQKSKKTKRQLIFQDYEKRIKQNNTEDILLGLTKILDGKGSTNPKQKQKNSQIQSQQSMDRLLQNCHEDLQTWTNYVQFPKYRFKYSLANIEPNYPRKLTQNENYEDPEQKLLKKYRQLLEEKNQHQIAIEEQKKQSRANLLSLISKKSQLSHQTNTTNNLQEEIQQQQIKEEKIENNIYETFNKEDCLFPNQKSELDEEGLQNLQIQLNFLEDIEKVKSQIETKQVFYEKMILNELNSHNYFLSDSNTVPFNLINYCQQNIHRMVEVMDLLSRSHTYKINSQNNFISTTKKQQLTFSMSFSELNRFSKVVNSYPQNLEYKFKSLREMDSSTEALEIKHKANNLSTATFFKQKVQIVQQGTFQIVDEEEQQDYEFLEQSEYDFTQEEDDSENDLEEEKLLAQEKEEQDKLNLKKMALSVADRLAKNVNAFQVFTYFLRNVYQDIAIHYKHQRDKTLDYGKYEQDTNIPIIEVVVNN